MLSVSSLQWYIPTFCMKTVNDSLTVKYSKSNNATLYLVNVMKRRQLYIYRKEQNKHFIVVKSDLRWNRVLLNTACDRKNDAQLTSPSDLNSSRRQPGSEGSQLASRPITCEIFAKKFLMVKISLKFSWNLYTGIRRPWYRVGLTVTLLFYIMRLYLIEIYFKLNK